MFCNLIHYWLNSIVVTVTICTQHTPLARAHLRFFSLNILPALEFETEPSSLNADIILPAFKIEPERSSLNADIILPALKLKPERLSLNADIILPALEPEHLFLNVDILPALKLEPERRSPNSFDSLVFFNFVSVIRISAGNSSRDGQRMTGKPVRRRSRLTLKKKETETKRD